VAAFREYSLVFHRHLIDLENVTELGQLQKKRGS
jgi:hypothetical protein